MTLGHWSTVPSVAEFQPTRRRRKNQNGLRPNHRAEERLEGRYRSEAETIGKKLPTELLRKSEAVPEGLPVRAAPSRDGCRADRAGPRAARSQRERPVP